MKDLIKKITENLQISFRDFQKKQGKPNHSISHEVLVGISKNKKNVWVGYWGPMLHQLGKAIDTIAGLDVIIIGFHNKINGEFNDGRELWNKNQVKIVCNEENLEKELKNYSTIFYDTYSYSDNARPEIFNLLKKHYKITSNKWWPRLRAKKILCDAESAAGQFDAYNDIAPFFDGIFTFNKFIKAKYPSALLSPVGISIPQGSIKIDLKKNRPIDILYTGSNITTAYRGEITRKLLSIKERANLNIVIGSDLIGSNPINFENWTKMLSETKIYLATYSCASGKKDPMHIKQKDAYALLYGATPLTEELKEADEYLQPGIHRAVFNDLECLETEILELLKDSRRREKIVCEGQKQVLKHFDWKNIAINALQYFKIPTN